MRKGDDSNDEVPATLGEYRDMCVAIGGENNDAVRLLDAKINKQGRNAVVTAPDSQMRALLMPKLGI